MTLCSQSRLLAACLLTATVLAWGSPTQAQTLQNEMTAPWSSARQNLRDQGVDVRAVYKLDVSALPPENKTNSVLFLGNLDLQLDFDFEKLFGWSGSRLFLWGVNNHGKNPSAFVGDFQFTSNIQPNRPGTKLLEAYWEQSLDDSRFSVLAGLHDLNMEFNLTDSSLVLLNSSFALGGELAQAGSAGPSTFPNTATAVRLAYQFAPELGVRVAAFNDEPALQDESGVGFKISPENGVLWISELSSEWELSGRPLIFKVGGWTYSNRPTPTQGGYGLVEHEFLPRFSGFLRAGTASGETLAIRNNFAGGVTWNQPFSKKRPDVLSFGITQATPQSIEDVFNETTYEITYKFWIAPGLFLQPDFQYVDHPTFSRAGIESAWIGTTRLEMAF